MLSLDYNLLILGAYLVIVVTLGIVVSWKKKGTDEYFLAGRNLGWWVIGGSVIAANISTHHFVGMSGLAYRKGLALASFEWLAALALILYAVFFLPYYLKSRITTMPEFLEKRFSRQVRLVYALISLVGYIAIELAVVLYTGSLAIYATFNLPLEYGLMVLCVAGAYTIFGGFKSVAYTDILQVTILILGGLAVTILGLYTVGQAHAEYGGSVLGGLRALGAEAPEKFHMVQPLDDEDVPWLGVFFGGLWLANIFYFGCNQFITQRTLAARSVWHGQMGAVFAGFLKLLVPVLVVLPGIIAFHLYNPDNGIRKEDYVLAADHADRSFLILVQKLLPPGLTGLVIAGLLGCVMSHIASMLSASSSILTFDIYKNYVNRDAGSRELIRFGRSATFLVLVLGTVIGFNLRDIPAIFHYIQKYWSIAYPSVCALFLTGFFYPRANARGSLITIIVVPTCALLFTIAEKAGWVRTLPFFNRAIIDFLLALGIIWLFRNRGEIPPGARIDRSLSPESAAALGAVPWYASFKLWAAVLTLIVVGLYIRFF